jgi:hypothetical protein
LNEVRDYQQTKVRRTLRVSAFYAGQFIKYVKVLRHFATRSEFTLERVSAGETRRGKLKFEL